MTLKAFLSYGRATRRQFMRHFTRNGAKLLYSRSSATPIDSDCCHLPTVSAFSNQADTSLSNSFRSRIRRFLRSRHAEKKRKCTEVRRDGGLELVKPAREQVYTGSKLKAPLENAPRILPVRRSLLALAGRKQKPWPEIAAFFSEISRFANWFSRTRVQHFSGSSTIELSSALAESVAHSPKNMSRCACLCFSTLSELLAKVAAGSCVPPTPEGTKLGLGTGAPDELHPHTINRRRITTNGQDASIARWHHQISL